MPLADHITAYLANNAESSDALNSIILSVFSKSIDVQGLVAQLGACLTSPQDETRARGTLLLSEVLTRLPGITLAPQAVNSLVTFFVQRLSDYVCIKEVILGLSALVQNHSSPNFVTPILNGIFKEVTVQTLPQSSRKKVFEMLSIFCQKYPNEVISLKETFVAGFMQSMDGEKDPRNLLLCFSLAEFTLTNLAECFTPTSLEEIFEITACYFPITFIAPKNDPHGITGEDLKRALSSCLSAHVGLVNHTFPLMLEKMDSGLYASKIDTLRMMTVCLRRLGSAPLEPFAGAIWASLKKEIVSGVDADLVAVALETLQAFVSVACPDQIGGNFVPPSTDDTSPTWTDFMEPMLDECEAELKLPDAKVARVYGKILSSSCGASGNAMEKVLARMWPCIEERFLAGDIQTSQRQALLEMVGDVLIQSGSLKLNPSRPHPLTAYVDKLCSLFLSSLIGSTPRMRCVVVIGLGALALLSQPSTSEPTLDSASAVTPSTSSTSSSSAAAPAEATLTITPPSPANAITSPANTISTSPTNSVSPTNTLSPSTASATTSATTPTNPASCRPPAVYLLSATQLQAVLATLGRLLFQDEDVDVRKESLHSLVRLSSFHAQVFLESVLPPLFAFPPLHVCVPAATPTNAAMTTSATTTPSSSASVATPSTITVTSPSACSIESSVMDEREESEKDVMVHLAPAPSPSAATPMLLTPRESPDNRRTWNEKQTTENTLEAIAALGATPELFKACVPQLLSILSNQFQDGALASHELTSQIIVCLNRMVTSNATGGGLQGPVVTALPISLFTAFTKAALSENGLAPVKEVEEILGTLTRAAPPAEHVALLDKVVSLFLDGNIAQFGISSPTAFRPFVPGCPVAQTRLIPLFAQVLGNHRVEAAVPQLDRLIGALIAFILNSTAFESPSPSLYALQCLGALVNKFPAGAALNAFVAVILLGQLRNKAANPGNDRLAALRAFIWVSKGLIMRGHSESNSLAEFLCRLLLDNDLAAANLAAEGFDVILADCPTLLNPRSLANISPQYKKNFFNDNIDRVLALFEQARRTPSSVVVLMALSFLLRHLPFAVIEPQLPKALPLMIQSLQTENAPLRRSTLKTMNALVEADVTSLSSHIGTLIPAMLRLTHDSTDMYTRILATLCLEHFTKLPFHLLFPHKTQVINELQEVLDDKKRLVRKQAVRTRNMWFSLSET